MSLIPWNPFREMDNFSREVNSFFENWPFGMGLVRSTSPRIDVYQTEKDVVLKAELPGVAKEDLNVIVDEYSIKISGQTRRDEEYKDDNIYRAERFYGSFARTIPLPVEVAADKAKGEYKDGILTITVPKKQPGKSNGRRIEIQ
ncbi:MAG: Hsp20/alpha crystallin family protein [Clostridiaceae bacterium]|nr:Hsp20/alpha crystallin family protein [Clostridiaceae bacterium]